MLSLMNEVSCLRHILQELQRDPKCVVMMVNSLLQFLIIYLIGIKTADYGELKRWLYLAFVKNTDRTSI